MNRAELQTCAAILLEMLGATPETRKTNAFRDASAEAREKIDFSAETETASPARSGADEAPEERSPERQPESDFAPAADAEKPGEAEADGRTLNPLTAEALDRTFSRDSRRYDRGFPTY